MNIEKITSITEELKKFRSSTLGGRILRSQANRCNAFRIGNADGKEGASHYDTFGDDKYRERYIDIVFEFNAKVDQAQKEYEESLIEQLRIEMTNTALVINNPKYVTITE